jgi:hypothetical protein
LDIDVARHIVRAAFRSGRELESLLSMLKAHCKPDEYNSYAKAIAAAVASIHMGVINRVTVDFTALEAEIEAQINKPGRYL